MIACLPGFGELCDLIRSMSDTVSSVGELVADPFLWLVHHLFPRDFLDLLAGQLDPGSDGNMYARLYRGMMPAGVATAAIAATARVVRSVFDERAAGAALVGDSVLRFGGGVLLLAAPTPVAATGDGLPAGWQVLRLGVNASVQLGRNVIGLLSSPSVFGADVSVRALVGRFIALAGLSTVPVLGFFFAIILILVGAGIVYMAMIMVMRSIMLAFAVAAAPVCIAAAVFDHRSRFFQWWWELFSGALLIPVVLGFTLALTTGFALRFGDPATAFLPVTGVLLGGMWFTGKAVHQLTWRHFSHGGITGALTALSTTAMAAPGLAAQASTALAAAGHAPRAGGPLDLLASMYRGRSGPSPPVPPSAPLERRAAELASSAAGASELAGAGAGAGVDLGAALAGGHLLGGPGVAEQVSRAAGAAIGRFAETPAGAATVMDATAAMPSGTPMADRVVAYARQIGADPALAGEVAGATVGAVLGGSLPDLGRLLAPRPAVRAEAAT